MEAPHARRRVVYVPPHGVSTQKHPPDALVVRHTSAQSAPAEQMAGYESPHGAATLSPAGSLPPPKRLFMPPVTPDRLLADAKSHPASPDLIDKQELVRTSVNTSRFDDATMTVIQSDHRHAQYAATGFDRHAISSATRVHMQDYAKEFNVLDPPGVVRHVVRKDGTHPEIQVTHPETGNPDKVYNSNIKGPQREHHMLCSSFLHGMILEIISTRMFAISAIAEYPARLLPGSMISARQHITVTIPKSLHAFSLSWKYMEAMNIRLRRCVQFPQLLTFMLKNTHIRADVVEVPTLIDEHRSYYHDRITPSRLVKTCSLDRLSDERSQILSSVFSGPAVWDNGISMWGMRLSPSRFSHLYRLKLEAFRVYDETDLDDKFLQMPIGSSPIQAPVSAAAADKAAKKKPADKNAERIDRQRHDSTPECLCCAFLHWCIIIQVKLYYKDKVTDEFMSMMFDNDTHWFRRGFLEIFELISKQRPEFASIVKINADLATYTTRLELPSLEFYRAWIASNRPSIHEMLRQMRHREDVSTDKRKRIANVLGSSGVYNST